MARSYEQDFVWVGMAKETAHQLGTPISSLMAWVEYQKAMDREEDHEMLVEVERDLQRLSTIADRFSKIGSQPKLDPKDLAEALQTALAYMRSRVPQKVEIEYEVQTDIRVKLNQPLFEWVIENLTRNAVDAMDGAGHIRVCLSRKGNMACIDFSETGKGIHPSQIKNIFKPGITTKKRGWGLGLTLVRRIIQNYHQGKIIVKDSKPGKGTTFRMTIPEYRWD
jgi:signal transduction histidine kinase